MRDGLFGKVMDEDELNDFVCSIDRAELDLELEERKKIGPQSYPRYLKAVRVTLIALGYDEEWVETVLKDALKRKYL